MDGLFYETDYEIAVACDEYGDFPLECAAMLFDLLGIKNNVIIKNQHVIRPGKEKALAQFIQNNRNCYFASHKNPESDYCIWIKHPFSTNQELIQILKLQLIYLSYIVPTDSFVWNRFVENWKKDERELLLSGQAAFICNVIDADRTLNLNFNPAFFSTENIRKILTEWEKRMYDMMKNTRVKRTAEQQQSKYGKKRVIRIFS